MTPEQRADEIEKAWVRFTPKWPGVKTLIVNAIRDAVLTERVRCAFIAERGDAQQVANVILKGETP